MTRKQTSMFSEQPGSVTIPHRGHKQESREYSGEPQQDSLSRAAPTNRKHIASGLPRILEAVHTLWASFWQPP